jgi:hypothetical protein
MYARVARWEGQDADALRTIATRISEESGPPEGVPAKGFLMLMDPDEGRSLAIALFDTEDDMRTGDETLNGMNPPGGSGDGNRVSVEMYEVGVDIRL